MPSYRFVCLYCGAAFTATNHTAAVCGGVCRVRLFRRRKRRARMAAASAFFELA